MTMTKAGNKEERKAETEGWPTARTNDGRGPRYIRERREGYGRAVAAEGQLEGETRRVLTVKRP